MRRALGWIARHFNFPYPIALVIGGGALGLALRLPQFPSDPQFILVLVLHHIEEDLDYQESHI